MWWREVSRGHSALAFFVGVNVCSCVHTVVTGFHFLTVYHLLSAHTLDYSSLVPLFLLQYFCGVGLAQLVSMFLQHAQSTIITTGALIVMATFNGYVVAWPKWLCHLFPSWWFGQTFFAQSMLYVSSVYDTAQALSVFRYSADAFGETARACAFMVCIGVAYRVLAFAGMMAMREER